VDSPWSNDFKALEDQTRERLPSLEATRTALSTRSPETKMRFFKSHPALAALITLLVLSLVGGAAYAVVREVFITIDPDKPADQIEQDVHDQLQAAGVPATVHASKRDDGKTEIRILGAHDPDVALRFADKKGNTSDVSNEALRLQLDLKCELTDAQQESVIQISSGPMVVDLAINRGDKSDDEVIAMVKKAYADAGFTDVDVAITGADLIVTIKSPPK
jgi:hypothetical protein